MKVSRRLKKKLIKKFDRKTVKQIISGELTYQAKITSRLSETGYKMYYGPKTLFREIR